jgi:hypothetical protein
LCAEQQVRKEGEAKRGDDGIGGVCRSDTQARDKAGTRAVGQRAPDDKNADRADRGRDREANGNAVSQEN